MGETVRTALRPGDLAAIIRLHGVLYDREYGFDVRFEAHVAEPLGRAVRRGLTERERIWLVEHEDELVGTIAIVEESPGTAQLRWFLVAPEARGNGLGGRLLHQAIAFSRDAGYGKIILWTVSALTDAARLYRMAGFRKVEEHPGQPWGRDVVEEKYEMSISDIGTSPR
ncbi:MAG TPA: GNAT family N-acetyltransferase [Gemmatimonadales bacterium]|jgi:GNAT superfamily N-acetyltransferase|nr:GNAT family N-acetyltransferase [Gemmatimonadales bacterium]